MFDDEPGQSVMMQGWHLASSPFIRFEFLPLAGLATTIPFAAGSTLRERDPSLEAACLSQEEDRSHVHPVLPCREQGNSDAQAITVPVGTKPVVA